MGDRVKGEKGRGYAETSISQGTTTTKIERMKGQRSIKIGRNRWCFCAYIVNQMGASNKGRG